MQVTGTTGFRPSLPPEFAEARPIAAAGGVTVVGYRLRGASPAAPALLWGHANGFSAGCYRPLLDRLSQHFQVFAFDARGHGAADKPRGDLAADYTMRRFAEDLASVADWARQCIGPAPALHYASHSLGGNAVLMLEGELGLSPFASLTLFEPPAYPPPGHEEREAGLTVAAAFPRWADRRRQRFPDREALRAEAEGIVTYRRFAPEMMAAYLEAALEPAEGGGFVLRCPGDIEAAVYRNCPNGGAFQAAAGVATRTRIYVSDPAAVDGHLWTPVTMRDIAASMAHGECRTMPGCLHLMAQEDPAACAAAIVDHALDIPAAAD
ncbi:MAG: alpha/beta fold hydrolase [Alphaproteobacteria bacterium]|jgi:pimeloyl-ACP methyl ester carboxylesterase|nr:alpha/beta fold hydrolase [Alphaproteobacteria bacterium]MDP6566053.1 alpha/beta fold hydrolase [Alphaproteobacteria bacterium]MDP6816116.1 alpha/beta fold hydrolase [Alphaproteobacteria bacterium]